MPAISSTAASASSSRMSSPVPSGSGSAQPIDAYRTISTQVKKPLLPLLPSSSSSSIPNLPTLLSLDPTTYSSRLSGKTLQTSDPTSSAPVIPSSNSISPLVKGKKRNRGYPSELEKARNEHKSKEVEMKELGLYGNGMRKVRRRLGGVMGKGMKVSYQSLIPLNHLHTTYLFQLLSLPFLPTPIPPISSSSGSTINPEILLSKISKADFTGMKILIISSKNQSLVGIKGIIIEETCSTFRIVTEIENTIKVIPKNGCLFRIFIPAYSPPKTISGQDNMNHTEEEDEFDLDTFLGSCPSLQIDLLGENFLNRSGDRAGKKLKPIQGNGGGSGWSQSWLKETDWDRTFDLLSEQLGEGEKKPQLNVEKQKNSKLKKIKGEKKKRKRNKSRRKDPPAFGNPE